MLFNAVKEMSISKSEWAEINKLILQATRPNGFKRFALWLREWGMVGVTISAFLTLIGINVTLGMFLSNRLEQNATFREKTDQRLAHIESDLNKLLSINTLRQAAELQPKELASQIPNIHAAIQNARQTDTKVPDQVLGSIQSGLLNVSDATPGFWPLAFDLISYRSMIITGMLSPPMAISEMANLRSHGPSQVRGSAVRLGGVIEGVAFTDCWIEFDLSRPVVLLNTSFDHCVLVFRGVNVRSPSPAYQQLARQILASNISEFKISSTG